MYKRRATCKIVVNSYIIILKYAYLSTYTPVPTPIINLSN